MYLKQTQIDGGLISNKLGSAQLVLKGPQRSRKNENQYRIKLIKFALKSMEPTVLNTHKEKIFTVKAKEVITFHCTYVAL